MILLPLALAEPAPLGWTAVSAEWTVTVREDQPVRLSARYTLAASDAQAGSVTLVGPELLILDAPGPVVATAQGLGVALNPDRRRLEQRIEGLYVPDTPGALSLGILRAARTRVIVDAPGLDVTIPSAVDGWLPPTDRLSISWAPHVEGEPTHVRAVVQGESATTFRGDAGAIAVDSVLRWKVLRGEVQRFTFDVAGLEELEVAGENIASWERTGNTVTVRTRAPVKGLLSVTVRGRTPPGKGERVAPTPRPTEVLRVDRYVTMARSDEGELIPLAAPASLALGSLPQWARSLGDAAPLASWHGADPVRILVATAEVLQGPGTVVTAARYTVAASRDGRVGVRMNLRVRNEHRQYLHIVPPKDGRWTPIVIRVGNQPKSWLSDGAGGIYVPLERSVETVRGPLSFPVDAEWIAQGVPWERRGEQTLRLPSIDAPVQSATWEVHLPRGYARVGAPVGGQEGFVLTDLRKEDVEAERKREEVVSSALQNAVSAYRQNDFSGAEKWLQEAQTVDSSNEEVAQLQSNLDVLSGKASTNDVASRRVRDLAKAKNEDVAEQQVVLEKEAEELLRAGDLENAEQRYSQALDIANTLQQTEQLESVEQKSKIEVAQNKLAEIAGKKSAKTSSSFGMGKRPSDVREDTTIVSETTLESDGDGLADELDSWDAPAGPNTEIDFGGLELEGELLKVDGALMLDREPATPATVVQDALDDEPAPEIAEEEDESYAYFYKLGADKGGSRGAKDEAPPEKPVVRATLSLRDTQEVSKREKKADEEERPPPAPASKSKVSEGRMAGGGSGRGEAGAASDPATITTSSTTRTAPKTAARAPSTPAASAAPPPPPPPPPVQSSTPMLADPEPIVAYEAPLGDANAVELSVGWDGDDAGGNRGENSRSGGEAQGPAEGGVVGGLLAGEQGAEQPVSGVALSQEFLATIPSGRSYQSVIGQTAGAVASPPVDTAIDTNRSYQGVAARGGKSGIARAAAEDRTGASKEVNQRRERVAAAEQSRDLERSERLNRSQVQLEALTQRTAELAARAEDPYLAGTEAGAMARLVLEQVQEVIAARDVSMAADLAPFVEHALSDLEIAAANRPRAKPPRVIERREPLAASPSPMALAMPLDGPAVSTRQALLPADTFPSWRLRYRRLAGEPD